MLQEYNLAAEHPFQIMDIEEDKSDHLQYKKGQLIYCENSTPLGVYFVQKGKVKISKIGCDGKEQILRIATENEMIGYKNLRRHDIAFYTKAGILVNLKKAAPII